MWKLLCVFLSTTLQVRVICGKLVGDHICLTEERYKVNVTEHYVRNVTVRNYKWCLNVPPRCSYYTMRRINDTRIVEKYEIKMVEKCCDGFIKKKNQCISACKDCQNGICIQGVCHCAPGFSGVNCDTKCVIGLWGPNCTNMCNCSIQFCDPVSGTCTSLVDDSISPKNYMSSVSLNEYLNTDGIDELKTTESLPVGEYSRYTTARFNSNIITVHEQSSSTASRSFDIVPNMYTTPSVEIPSTKRTSFIDILVQSSTKKPGRNKSNIIQNQQTDNIELIIPVGIQYDQIAKPLLQEDSVSPRVVLNLNLEKDSKPGSSKISTNGYYFINSISVSAASLISLIILAVIMFLTRRKRKQRDDKTDDGKNENVSAVAVYTTSIFHTPLPDPPVCENTTYLFPRECQNCVGEPSVEPHVIYNITASTHLMKDYKNYEYDYPPSTGSYRAASIIEPVDTDANKNNIFSHAEPLYDEIPCRGRQEQEAEMTYENQSISLYMNTSPVRKLSELK